MEPGRVIIPIGLMWQPKKTYSVVNWKQKSQHLNTSSCCGYSLRYNRPQNTRPNLSQAYCRPEPTTIQTSNRFSWFVRRLITSPKRIWFAIDATPTLRNQSPLPENAKTRCRFNNLDGCFPIRWWWRKRVVGISSKNTFPPWEASPNHQRQTQVPNLKSTNRKIITIIYLKQIATIRQFDQHRLQFSIHRD